MKFSTKDFFSKCDQIRRSLLLGQLLVYINRIYHSWFTVLQGVTNVPKLILQKLFLAIVEPASRIYLNCEEAMNRSIDKLFTMIHLVPQMHSQHSSLGKKSSFLCFSFSFDYRESMTLWKTFLK